MNSMLSRALSSLLKENSGAIEAARAIAEATRLRPRKAERVANVVTGEECCRWHIEFSDETQMARFENALSLLISWDEGDE